MDEKTLTALQESIKKWEAIALGTKADEGSDDCKLCIEFQETYGPDDDDGEADTCCALCPVRQQTGHSLCVGTPYIDWWTAIKDLESNFASTPKLKAIATAELEFLRSLLPASP